MSRAILAVLALILVAYALRRRDDQAWFWTPEWQASEREADADIAAGRTRVFDSTADFLASLDDDWYIDGGSLTTLNETWTVNA